MKKADEPKSRITPRYDLKGGVRGKYAGQVSRTADVVARLRVWAPLVDFPWTGGDRDLTSDTSIRVASAYRGYDSPDFNHVLAPSDRELCRGVQHWLLLNLPVHHPLSASESMNSFLSALWVVRPTRTHITLRFTESPNDSPSVFRVLDRFQWIKGQVRDKIGSDDLDDVKDVLPRLQSVYLDRGRLRNALVLTFRGCVSSEWQPAFICWTAAMESMLTYQRGPGLTDRLAGAYARLVETSGLPTDAVTEKFKTIYDIRSDIVHGRSYDRDQSAQNREDLASCSDMLRRLWRAALATEKTRSVLESDDSARKAFFVGA